LPERSSPQGRLARRPSAEALTTAFQSRSAPKLIEAPETPSRRRILIADDETAIRADQDECVAGLTHGEAASM